MRFYKISFLVWLFMTLSTWATDAKDSSQILPILSDHMTAADWKSFAKIGCGYYPIPQHVKDSVAKTLKLAQSLNASYQGQAGYDCEKEQQIEIMMLEKKNWARFPQETIKLAEEMSKIGQSIVVHVLKALEINPRIYSKSTGGLCDGNGKNYLKLAHYDAVKNYPALPWHKDIRFVTVLFINQEGLQGQVNNVIIDVKPLEGHFVVNLGVYFEALINDAEKLRSFIHQVQQVKQDRSSFGVFCEGDYPQNGFYQLQDGELVWKTESLKAYLIEDKDKSFTMSAHAVYGDRL